MMKKFTVYSTQLAAFLLSVVVSFSAVAAYSPDMPNDLSAQAAAQRAVNLLGSTRGALSLVTDVRLVTGLNERVNSSGLTLTTSVEELNQAMKDLGAQVAQTQIVVELPSDILFDFDKWDIKPEAVDELKNLSVIIKQKAKHAEIIGYTDSKGGEAYNQNLSLKRANSVMSWLIQNAQIPATILFAKGMGEAQPKASNNKPDGSDDPDGRAKNRRVEIVVTTQS